MTDDLTGTARTEPPRPQAWNWTRAILITALAAPPLMIAMVVGLEIHSAIERGGTLYMNRHIPSPDQWFVGSLLGLIVSLPVVLFGAFFSNLAYQTRQITHPGFYALLGALMSLPLPLLLLRTEIMHGFPLKGLPFFVIHGMICALLFWWLLWRVGRR